MPDLAGLVALVTGGGTGLGAETCRLLAAAGARVAVGWSSSREAATELAASLHGAIAVQADVRDIDAVQAMVHDVEERLAPVDLLVNDAGTTTYVAHDDLDAITTDDWERILGVNVIGAWNCTKAVMPSMRRRASGAIVNVASDAAFTGEGSSVPYVASKAALATITRSLAAALTPIRVNAVAPGWMDTPWLDRYVPEDVVRGIRDGTEESVEVEVVAREIVELLRDDDANGLVVQLEAGGFREVHFAD
jgi:3-oxoacyl-[acyl-carrier protein] reductase